MEKEKKESESFELKLKEASRIKYVAICRALYNRLCRRCQANLYMSAWLKISNPEQNPEGREHFIKSSENMRDALKRLCPVCSRVYKKVLEENK